MAASDAIPVPRKNAAFRFTFAIRKPSDSTLITTWTGMDSEVSLDGAAFADCTNEATEIGTSGVGYIDLTAAEMNADTVALKVTVTNTGAVPLVFTFLPESAGDYRVSDTQKVDVETIKGQTLTAAAGITFGVYVGGTSAALPLSSYTSPPSAVTISAQVASDLAAAHGSGSWATATGFSTHSASDVWAVGSRTLTAFGFTVTLADGVTHGGTTAKLRLGSSTTTPAFHVTNTHTGDNSHAVYFVAGSAASGGAGLMIDGGGLTTSLGAPGVEGLYTGGDAVAHQAEVAAILVDTNELQTDWVNGGRLDSILDIIAADTTTDIPALIAAEAVKTSAIQTAVVTTIPATLLIINDGVGYLTSALLGTISDAGTAGETYVVTFGGATYTLDYTGLDATGNRSGVTRTKT